jgi:hypothetical protein
MSLDDLGNRELKICSQNGEDGVVEAIFETIGTTNRYFVEFGVEDATECNTAALLARGWQGLMMDAAGICRNPLATVRRAIVTAENVNALFRHFGVPDEFDLLSIDIDGNDFWVWREIAFRPRVLVVEYNASMGPSERRAIVYEPWFCFRGTDYFGASLAAFVELGRQRGYTLVYCERTGVNAFFIADEALPRGYQPPETEALYRPPNYLNRGQGWPADPSRRMIDPFLGRNDLYCKIVAGWCPP